MQRHRERIQRQRHEARTEVEKRGATWGTGTVVEGREKEEEAEEDTGPGGSGGEASGGGSAGPLGEVVVNVVGEGAQARRGKGPESTAIPGVARGEIHTYLPT